MTKDNKMMSYNCRLNVEFVSRNRFSTEHYVTLNSSNSVNWVISLQVEHNLQAFIDYHLAIKIVIIRFIECFNFQSSNN